MGRFFGLICAMAFCVCALGCACSNEATPSSSEQSALAVKDTSASIAKDPSAAKTSSSSSESQSSQAADASSKQAANAAAGQAANASSRQTETANSPATNEATQNTSATQGASANGLWTYTDENGDSAKVPAGFNVSTKTDEQRIQTGLVVIAPDGNEFVWVPTTQTALAQRDFGSYFGSDGLSTYWDETSSPSYQAMVDSVQKYGGFYMGRYEASAASGEGFFEKAPASVRVDQGQPYGIWVNFSPQDATVACEQMYADNPTVQGFFPWGINWDTTLQWLVDSGNKTQDQVSSDSTSWGNYSNDEFSPGSRGASTGVWEEAKANNIYDLAGNNWEWTQERQGSSNYVMRGGGYNLMGGDCLGYLCPAALRDPLPGNNHHPNVTFRIALYLV